MSKYLAVLGLALLPCACLTTKKTKVPLPQEAAPTTKNSQPRPSDSVWPQAQPSDEEIDAVVEELEIPREDQENSRELLKKQERLNQELKQASREFAEVLTQLNTEYKPYLQECTVLMKNKPDFEQELSAASSLDREELNRLLREDLPESVLAVLNQKVTTFIADNLKPPQEPQKKLQGRAAATQNESKAETVSKDTLQILKAFVFLGGAIGLIKKIEDIREWVDIKRKVRTIYVGNEPYHLVKDSTAPWQYRIVPEDLTKFPKDLPEGEKVRFRTELEEARFILDPLTRNVYFLGEKPFKPHDYVSAGLVRELHNVVIPPGFRYDHGYLIKEDAPQKRIVIERKNDKFGSFALGQVPAEATTKVTGESFLRPHYLEPGLKAEDPYFVRGVHHGHDALSAEYKALNQMVNTKRPVGDPHKGGRFDRLYGNYKLYAETAIAAAAFIVGFSFLVNDMQNRFGLADEGAERCPTYNKALYTYTSLYAAALLTHLDLLATKAQIDDLTP